MDLRQLRSLIAVAEEKHFSRAAARLHIAQPSLSQQIRQLEQELGLALFHRTTRQVRLTDAGALLTARARVVLTQIDDARAELQQMTGLLAGRVTIGLTQTPGPLDVVRLLADFHAAYPSVELSVREDLSTRLAEQLRNDDLDIGFLSLVEASDRHGLTVTELSEEPLVIVLPGDHRLSDRTHATIADLRDEDFVAFSTGATIRTAVARISKAHGFEPRIAFESREVTRIRAIVAAGLGVAILPQSDAQSPGPPVQTVQLHNPALTHRISLCWREGRQHSPAARMMLEQARVRHSDADV